ncbi:hypothetical protein JCM14722_11200 [Pseudodesulfovibrio portus]|uniref:Uncharacterized protein n=1 Tax=Pseudodesulfovibrio portus TaxID=231439 RepID=A0ABM8AQK3_9BACT|nr:hypothetical protein JCM14722_11200 [Pseudodesulfovibrio portus]
MENCFMGDGSLSAGKPGDGEDGLLPQKGTVNRPPVRHGGGPAGPWFRHHALRK